MFSKALCILVILFPLLAVQVFAETFDDLLNRKRVSGRGVRFKKNRDRDNGISSYDQPGNRDHISGLINDAENLDGLEDASGQQSDFISNTIKDALKIVNFGSPSYNRGGTKKGLKTGTYLE